MDPSTCVTTILSFYQKLRPVLLDAHPDIFFRKSNQMIPVWVLKTRVDGTWFITLPWMNFGGAYQLIHNAILAFNLPATPHWPNRITSCPKCNEHQTDLYQGVHLQYSQTYWARVETIVKSLWCLSVSLPPMLAFFHHWENSIGESCTPKAPAPIVHNALLLKKKEYLLPMAWKGTAYDRLPHQTTKISNASIPLRYQKP